jgi:hypothetical protein
MTKPTIIRSVLIGILSVFIFFGKSSAEGGCPPGSYPVGGQGVQGCAPIPTGGPLDSEGPKPTGRWIKTWGAIALSSGGDTGVSVGKVRKADAVKEAELLCAQYGAADCKVAYSYKNQCAAAATPASGFGGTLFARAGNKEIAMDLAIQACSRHGGDKCEVKYSACTEPLFERF